MKSALILLLPVLVFPLWIVSSEFGTLEVIYELLKDSGAASLAALSVDDPEVVSILSAKKRWIITEYPSPLGGKTDTSEGLFHAKFAILDDVVIFGSMNFTERSLREDLNDAIVFEERCAVEFFSSLMDSLWYGLPIPRSWKCSFGEFHVSPVEDLERVVMRLLEDAKERVEIAVYAFTDMNVFGALKYLTSKGIRVRIAVDEWSRNWILKHPTGPLEVKVIEGRTLHHKFMIVDGKVLITGSANFTESAFRKNLEVVFVSRDGDIIRAYEEIFDELWGW